MEEEKKEGETCQFNVPELNYFCGRPVWENDEYCIFHSDKIEKKKTEFKKEFDEEFERQKEKKKTFDFTGFKFPDSIFFGLKFEMQTNFNITKFYGLFTDFTSAEFSENVSFLGSEFSNITTFRKCKFKKEVHFKAARFSGNTDFIEATFSNDADFEVAKFEKEIDFNDSKFYGNASFKQNRFFDDVDFKNVEFHQNTQFVEARFEGCAKFGFCKFYDEANFSNVKFQSEADFQNTSFEDVNKLIMENTFLFDQRGIFELIEKNKGKYEYLKIFKRGKDFRVTKFLPKNFKLIPGGLATAKNPVLSRQIKDDMYLIDFKEKHPKGYFIWWLFADCGRSFKKWAFWSLGIALIFAVIFLLIGPTAFKPKSESYTWFSFFYYSFVTFTTLGFGDITPIKWFTEILVTIEVVFGYVMLGGLISILANKLARRS